MTDAKHERAIKFLGELLNETGDWSFVDTQFELAMEFAEILGIHTPDWLGYAFKDSDDETKSKWEKLTGRKVPTETE